MGLWCSENCCAECSVHSYRAAGCSYTLRPAAIHVSTYILTETSPKCKRFFLILTKNRDGSKPSLFLLLFICMRGTGR